MIISEYLRSNETRMRQMRQDGETWETIATLVGNETCQGVNVASLRKTYSRLFGGNETQVETPAKVEKPVRKRAVGKLNDNAKPLEKTDQTQDLEAALLAAEQRASQAFRERDSEREVVAKTEQDRDRLRVEIDRLKSEIEIGKRMAEPGEEAGSGGKKDVVIHALRIELSEAQKRIDHWEKWSEERGDDTPRSRPIMVAAMVVGALIVGAGAGGYGSRFMANPEPLNVAVAVAAPQKEEVKPAPMKIESETKSEPVSGALNRPAGLPPLPPKPLAEGALTSSKKGISLLD